MHVHVLDENDLASPESTPASLDPFPWNETIYKKVKMGNSAFVKFEYRNVLNENSVGTAQVKTEFIEHFSQVANGTALYLCRIKCQSQEPIQMFLFCEFCYQESVTPCFSRSTITACPALAIHSMQFERAII
jgi:hypothetical protein